MDRKPRLEEPDETVNVFVARMLALSRSRARGENMQNGQKLNKGGRLDGCCWEEKEQGPHSLHSTPIHCYSMSRRIAQIYLYLNFTHFDHKCRGPSKMILANDTCSIVHCAGISFFRATPSHNCAPEERGRNEIFQEECNAGNTTTGWAGAGGRGRRGKSAFRERTKRMMESELAVRESGARGHLC